MRETLGQGSGQPGSLTIWEALKLAEDRFAYGSIAVDGRPDLTFQVFGGRLLTTDGEGNSLDLVHAIAEVLAARDLCRLEPLFDIRDAETRPSVSIGESLVASVRLTAASATLTFDAEESSGDIAALAATPGRGQKAADADEPARTDEPANTGEPESSDEDNQARRKAEADRLRAEFFERRSHRRRSSSGGIAVTQAVPISRPAPSPASPPVMRRRSDAVGGRPVDPLSAALQPDAQRSAVSETESKPTQRTALRSLIRNLMS